MTSRFDNNAAPRSSMGERTILAGILLVGLLIRLPFRPKVRDTGDSLYYSIGALYSHVAHPPGSIGYCLLLGWVNHLLGDIRVTLLVVSLTAAMVGTLLCHRVAKMMGLRPAAALGAAGCWCFSVNTLHASLIGTPHVVEGVMSLLFGLLAWRAVQTGRVTPGVAASLVLGLAGAVRPTTTPLLIPLWLWMIWRSTPTMGPRLKVFAVNAAVLIPLVAAYSWGNSHYMTVNGYGGHTYADQIISGSTYDYANLSGTAVNARAESKPAFHMPAAEVLAWLEVKTGLRLMPHVPDWPTPSLKRAAILSATQSVKQVWWVVFSLPLILLTPAVMVLWRGRARAFARPAVVFLWIWIVPPALFFVVGHLGTLEYVLIYLGPLSVVVAGTLLNRSATTGGTAAASRWPAIAVGSALLMQLAFFAFARPFQAGGGVKRTVDVIALQFTGPSRRAAFATSRNIGNTQSNADLATVEGPDHDYIAARSDAELLAAARKNHYRYAPDPMP